MPIKNRTLTLTTSTGNVLTLLFGIDIRMFMEPNRLCISFLNFYIWFFFGLKFKTHIAAILPSLR